MTSSLLNRYMRKHGHPLRARLSIGKRDRLDVYLHDGYIELHMVSPHRPEQTIFIPRRQLIRLLRWLVPQVRLMAGPSHYVPDAVRQYFRFEERIRREQKALKAEHQEVHRRRRPKRA